MHAPRLRLLAGALTALALASSCASNQAREPVVETTPIGQEVALATFEAAWEAVDDQHFDAGKSGVDWQAVHDELLPRVEAVETEEELRAVLRDMVARLGQSHFAVLPRSRRADTGEEGAGEDDVSGGVGIDVRLRDGRVLVFEVEPGSPAYEAGVRPGWVVARAGSREASKWLARAADSEEEDPRHIAYAAREVFRNATFGPVGSRVELAFLDGKDRPVELTLGRVRRSEEPSAFGNLPSMYIGVWTWEHEVGPLSVGRLRFSQWFMPAQRRIDEAIDAFREKDGIVLDLRGNSGGAGGMVMGLAGHFFSEREPLGTMITRAAELKFVANPRFSDTRGQAVEPYAGPLAILVDETSGSASEMCAGGIQSTGRARVFGLPTLGAVLPATTTELPNGDVLMHAMADFVTAQGVRLEGPGVQPDERVPLTRADLLQGRDPQLEAALEWIAAQARP